MATKKTLIKDKSVKIDVPTPVGMLLYPYLAKPDEGRENSSGKYQVDLAWDVEELKADKQKTAQFKAFQKEVLKLAREATGDPKFKLSKFKHSPIKLGDDKDNPGVYEGKYYITAKTEYKPTVVNAKKKELTEAELNAIKGGDFARIVVTIYPYTQSGGGVTFGLKLVQFSHAGEAVGGSSGLDLIDDIEVDLEDPDMDSDADEEEETPDMEEDDDDEEDEEPVKKPKKKSKKSTSKKKKASVEEDEDDEDEEDDEDDDELGLFK